jgi:phenylacetate-CoA ligase
MLYNPEIETLPLPKLRKLQNERLRHLLLYLNENVSFYRELFEKEGIQPEKVNGVEELGKLPFTRKSDLRDQYPFGLFARSMSEVRRIHASSGTTGKPTVVGYTQADLDLFSEVVARSLAAAGARPGMKLHNAYGYGLFTGGLGLHYGAEKLGMAVVPVSGGMTERQLRLIRDFRPEVISCTPSYAQTLAEAFEKQGISPEELSLKTAILGAEPWTEAIREQVEAGLGVQAVNIYGLSEIIGPGVSNEEVAEKGTGSYVWEDHFFPEIVDPDTGEPLAEGKPGVLVFTTLTKQAMPLLRYWTNDITYLTYEHSEKRTHVKMGPIMGRTDDMLIIRGVNLFPTQVEAVMEGFAELSPFYQLIISRPDKLDQVEVRIELEKQVWRDSGLQAAELAASDAFREVAQRLQHRIRDNIGLGLKVTLEAPEQIPRSAGGKLNRVLDERKGG